ncbi:MAG: helicase-related protein [Hyphomicrobiales bacterium]|nr:helicase-related protein [Hyphomicrobiales bacterium]
MTPACENLVAVLGPTNTGKTHLAIERMLGHASGMIGLPLRLLAREIYNKVIERIDADQVALITGEEKIKPPSPRYYVCTVEAMPRDVEVAFLAVDEIQLAADFDRGHVFTDRMLHRRGRQETLLLGADTIRPLIESLLPGVNLLQRPRLSALRYSGQTKLTRLPRRAAIVAFSANEVYAIAELVRRQRGGTAVVLGALSPRTRNAQVDLYQAGEVDYLVATDAIGMGLNLDIDHVAFAADRKFDGHQFRTLSAAEISQIAGRAGRHLRDGTFGVTGRVEPFAQEVVERLEGHRFEPLKMLQWRNSNLDFASLDALKASLAVTPTQPGLTRAPIADDERALDIVCRDADLRDMSSARANVACLWEVCQIPDYRKIAPANHAELIATIFGYLQTEGRIPDDWFARQVAYADRTDGDIDTLSNRIAHVRTWTFVANRPDWLDDPAHWQGQTREIEDRLSDALHACLAQRFVDRRTSVLLRRLRDNVDLELEIEHGDVRVEGQHVGHLRGFHFAPDAAAGSTHGKTLRAAALKGLAAEYSSRATRLAEAADKEIGLGDQGELTWAGETVARLVPADDALVPRIALIADDQLQGPDRNRIQERLDRWIAGHIGEVLAPLLGLRTIQTDNGLLRGIAFRLVECFGFLPRHRVSDEMRQLDQEARGVLRRIGVRFGAHTIFIPALLKPAATRVIRLLWALRHGGLTAELLENLPQPSVQGLMSVAVDDAVPKGYYAAIGYRICARRAVRVDMLERLADAVRPLIAWKPAENGAAAPEGALGKGRFVVTAAMMSLVGCSGESFAEVLKSIGFRRDGSALLAATGDTAASEPAAGDASAAANGNAPAAGAPAPEAPDNPKADAADSPRNTPGGSTAILGVWRVRVARPKRPRAAADKKGETPREQRSAPARARKKWPRKTDRQLHGRDHSGAAKRPDRKPGTPDPLSPFAALAELKRELEDAGKSGRKR